MKEDCIKAFFFKNPTRKIRVRQLERETGVSLPSVIQAVKSLVTANFLQVITIENVTFYAANRQSDIFLLEKQAYNLQSLQQLRLFLRTEYSNAPMILFGSFTKGEDIEESDIDIYIQSTKQELNLKPFEKKLERSIQLHFFRDIRKISNIFLANNIINGISLNGTIEVFKK